VKSNFIHTFLSLVSYSIPRRQISGAIANLEVIVFQASRLVAYGIPKEVDCLEKYPIYRIG